MPQNQPQFPFTGQSLRGMELDVKSEAQGTANWACLFAATAFDVQVAAATTSRQHTLNKGSRTSTGAAGEITATCDVFVVPDSPGQWTINQAFRSGNKVDIRRCLFASKVGDDSALSTSSGKVVSITIGAARASADANTPKAGGLLTFADGADEKTLGPLLAEAEPGMTLQVGSNNYFIGYRAPDVGGVPQLYISPSPDDNDDTTPATLIPTYPYIGAERTETTNNDPVRLYRGRVETTMYKGTVTVPVVATDAAPGDDGNDLSTAQISFALDDIGTPSYTFPS